MDLDKIKRGFLFGVVVGGGLTLSHYLITLFNSDMAEIMMNYSKHWVILMFLILALIFGIIGIFVIRYIE